MLPWPANSPDLNPIENLWAFVSRKVYDRSVYPNIESLWTKIQAEWADIPVSTLHKLYDSMPRRLEAVAKSRGSPTRY